jgi:carbamoyl-phosphate synthase large subunit
MKLRLKIKDLPKDFNEFNRIKSIGFSDKKLSELTKTSEDIIRRKRMALKILPVFQESRYLCS